METFDFPALEGVPVTIKGSSPAERAAEIVAHARATAESVASAAEAAGREAGYAAGLDEGRGRVAAAEATLAQVVRELDAAGRAHREQVERRAAELAVALAEKIVGAALEVRPELVVDVVATSLRGIADRSRVVVEVSPDDLELVSGAVSGIADAVGGLGHVDVVAERRVDRGGCIVHTDEAELDGTAAAQIERAAEIVREALASARD
jgi:flagellar biosynthesis/type III secretory pathway protein FliH